MVELYKRALDGLGMPAKWTIGLVINIVMKNVCIKNCRCYRNMKLLENGIKVVKRMLKSLYRIVTANDCNLVLSLIEKKSMQCLSQEYCEKSIMLR